MIKKDLVNRIASLGLSKKKAKAAMAAIIEGIGEGLAWGEKVQIQGLGSFDIRVTKERKGRNPRTGEPLKISSRKVPIFRPAPILKEKVK
jgi:DNA-binding protein HU-beta